MMATRVVSNSEPSAAVAVAAAAVLASCYVGIEPSQGDSASSTADAPGTAYDTSAVDGDDSGGAGSPSGGYEPAELAFPGLSSVPATILVDTPDGPIEVAHLLYENGYGVWDGDIILYGPEMSMMQVEEVGGVLSMVPQTSAGSGGALTSSKNQRGGVISWPEGRWPGAIIPYVLDDDLPHPERFFDAVQHWEENTPVRLVPRTTEDDYMLVLADVGCYSFMGRKGGEQKLSLAAACTTGNAVHEIGHAAGLYHEQKRTDAGMYIELHEENVHPSYQSQSQFANYGEAGVDLGEYDFGSVMHYSSCDLSVCTNDDGTLCLDQGNGSRYCDPTKQEGTCICTFHELVSYEGCQHCNCRTEDGDCLNPSFTLLDGSLFKNQRDELSDGDRAAVDYLYGQCPEGNGFYCGGPIGLDEFTLYECMDGRHTVVQVCGGCIVEPGADDACPEGVGSCPEGDGLYCGEEVGLNAGALYSCTAGEYAIAEACAYECSVEAGPNDQCIDQCSSGLCCDGGVFSSSDAVCAAGEEVEYGCPWGTEPGNDVGVRYRDRHCSGSDADCSGSLGSWGEWQLHDSCAGGEICAPDDASCNPAPVCTESDAWDPSSMSTVEWDQTGSVQQVELEVQEVSGDQVRLRVCKVGGGTFLNDIDVYFEEWVKYPGMVIQDGSLSSAGSACSQWAYVDTSAWDEGEGLGGEVRVVSPDSCAGVWGQWCSGVDPGCGYCWFLNTSIMTRTCQL